MEEIEIKRCPVCHKCFTGRTDKKFCSDACRTAFNNRRYRSEKKNLSKIDRILKRNRSILNRLYTEGHCEIPLFILLDQGFHTGFITAIEERKGHETERFCYEFSYRISEERNVRIMRHESILQ